ncbi:MAG: tRNA lysidine(34) synthetase TilS [Chloroflexi bacterium]|nr:MAG: tRNA lysidine(34) synthetase TilS [Chloroflexota bacterium]
MFEQLSFILQHKCQFDPHKFIIVGVSGGPDSLCLLDVLYKKRYKVVAAHLNHQLRQTASEDAEMVRGVAARMRIPFVVENVDVEAFAAANSVSIEEAARITRYRFLFRTAVKGNAQAVAVAHNADDQVETFLMHLLRGSGLSGLRGMEYRSLPNSWSDTIPLVRPLLGIWREEIVAYLKERKLQPVFDVTNLNVNYQRNRVRHALLPYLEGYNPETRKILFRTAQLLTGDYEIIEKYVQKVYERTVVTEVEGAVGLQYEFIRAEDVPVQRHLLRKAIAALRPGLRDINFEAIERFVSFLQNPPRSGQTDLTAGLRLVFEGDKVWVADWNADLPTGGWPSIPKTPIEFIPPTTVELGDGWVLAASEPTRIEDFNDRYDRNQDPFTAWIDPTKIQLPLMLRRRMAGDRYRPLGMEGNSLKLSDLMINHKLPKRARESWPIVCSGDEVVWVPGIRPGHAARLDNHTAEVVQLKLCKEAGES